MKRISKDFTTRRHQRSQDPEGWGRRGNSTIPRMIRGGISRAVSMQGLKTGDLGRPHSAWQLPARSCALRYYRQVFSHGAHTQTIPEQRSWNNSEKEKPNSWMHIFWNSTDIPFRFSRRDVTLQFKQISNKCILEPIAQKHECCSSSIRNKNVQIKSYSK